MAELAVEFGLFWLVEFGRLWDGGGLMLLYGEMTETLGVGRPLGPGMLLC